MTIDSFHSCSHHTDEGNSCFTKECVICKYISCFYDVPFENKIVVDDIFFISETKECVGGYTPAFISSFHIRPPPSSMHHFI